MVPLTVSEVRPGDVVEHTIGCMSATVERVNYSSEKVKLIDESGEPMTVSFEAFAFEYVW